MELAVSFGSRTSRGSEKRRLERKRRGERATQRLAFCLFPRVRRLPRGKHDRRERDNGYSGDHWEKEDGGEADREQRSGSNTFGSISENQTYSFVQPSRNMRTLSFQLSSTNLS